MSLQDVGLREARWVGKQSLYTAVDDERHVAGQFPTPMRVSLPFVR